jgi:hypothetical protein
MLVATQTYISVEDILALEGDDFRRAITLPVEDMLHMVWPPDLEREYRAGVFRWFRSENVVDLLKIHRTRQEAVGQIRRLTGTAGHGGGIPALAHICGPAGTLVQAAGRLALLHSSTAAQRF